MSSSQLNRREIIASAAGMASLSLLNGKAIAQLALPKSPVTINFVDAAGNLALTQPIWDAYRKAKPDLVSRVTYVKSPLPELPGKIRAQQEANRVDIDVVLCGYSGVAFGSEQNLWLPLLPTYASSLPNLGEILLPGARTIQTMTKGQGVCVSFTPFGPLLAYLPNRVKEVPKTADELLAWARANKNRFAYARPANSGMGLALLVGLPHILGDANPKDPIKGWDKTWAYLKALGENIEYYPPGSAAMLKEFGEGSRDMMPTTTGFDINPRALGVIPKEAKVAAIKGFHWMSDAHFMCVPKGVPADKLAVLLDMMSFALTREQQANIFDAGYYYPGPAVKGVTLDMAPAASQAVIKEFGRPEYDQLIASNPIEPPLDPSVLPLAFRRWDEEVGGAKRR
jgi:putative spermidine/putrescine transport system substrate-binding protein